LSVTGDHRCDSVEGALERHRHAFDGRWKGTPFLRCSKKPLKGIGSDDHGTVRGGSVSQHNTDSPLALLV
jgi:hypothetical protein